MALKTFVKISNISSLSDARYCAGMMVDLLGFNIDPSSENKVTSTDYREITEWVSGVSFVGEFENADQDNICQALGEYAIDYIQIADLSAVENINLLGKPLIFQLSIETKEDLDKLKSELSYLDGWVRIVVIRSSNPALFEAIDSQIGCYNNANLRLLKGFGVTENDDLAKFQGLEMEATEEEKPGFKDYGDIMDVLESIEKT
ncbi:MAG: hypothetical protein GDA42_03665 [Ekhidna sp.]|nr:hypothetical protein [Ekhidna sp.]MBC6409544.1 hypothetical protein [Ekhidna sp.]